MERLEKGPDSRLEMKAEIERKRKASRNKKSRRKYKGLEDEGVEDGEEDENEKKERRKKRGEDMLKDLESGDFARQKRVYDVLLPMMRMDWNMVKELSKHCPNT